MEPLLRCPPIRAPNPVIPLLCLLTSLHLSADARAEGGTCTVPPVEIRHTATQAKPVTVQVVSTANHPLAVCNDGTPATYLFRPGVGVGKKRWIL
ncbi:pectin acetylesterase-family hydrolase [Stigmatella sp. ncwal1]|uniref:Pectin acetylesterase-family hydrolase n=1 Tax=Stigmatella ashevillensis TaxID=2995309 RepID=A0ABT5DEZ7_9BACT|nr:pectin acetylesterase-family hydrolase [Stigmatella ashevillena]MDC0712207.1 pectin acetylesterase-family hydrolase [Stigmatella ashevillena]